MRLSALALLLLAGCPSDPDDFSFRIVAPSAGTQLDRCHTRIRTTPPVADALWGPGGGNGLDIREHVNWRVDGGHETEVPPMSVNLPERGNFVFGVTLRAGSQTLEAGNCDAFDVCEFQSLPLVVANASGAPDCDGPGGGQMMLDERNAFSVTPLADGRTVLGVVTDSDLGLIMMKADGTRDTTFGMMGRASIPLFPDAVVQLGDGSFWALGSGNGLYLGHILADGSIDHPFGSVLGTTGVRFLPCPGGLGSGCQADVMRSDGAGGAYFAGTSSMGTFVMQLDASANVTASVIVESTTTPPHYAMSIDASGRALFTTGTDVMVASLAGIETSFGTAGHLTVPTQGSAPDTPYLFGAISGTHIAVARVTFSGNTQVIEMQGIEAGVARPLITTTLATTPTVLNGVGVPFVDVDASGRAYISVGREHAPVPDAWRSMAPGTEVLTMRLVDGALDTSFGAQGFATMTALDVWSPVATENLYDLPKALAIGADGAPWLLASSQSFGTETDPYLLRGPGVMLSRIKL